MYYVYVIERHDILIDIHARVQKDEYELSGLTLIEFVCGIPGDRFITFESIFVRSLNKLNIYH